MQIEVPGCQFAEFAEAAAHAQALDRRALHMLEHRADEVAHFDQRDIRQAVMRAHRVFAGVAGAGREMQVAVRTRDVDALMNRRDIGRARERPHDAGGAENRQAAENAEARVHRFQCECFAAFDADRHFEAAGVSMFRGEFGQMLGHHLARHRD